MTIISIATGIVSALALYVGTYNLIFSLRVRERNENMYFSCICFSVALFALFAALLYNSDSYERIITLQRAQASSIALICIFMYIYIIRMLNFSVPKLVSWSFPVFWGLFLFIPWINHPSVMHISKTADKTFEIANTIIHYKEMRSGIVLDLFFISCILGMILAYYLLGGAYRKEREKRYLIVILSLTVFFLAGVNDILMALEVISSIYMLEYSFLSIIILIDYSIMIEFSELHNMGKEMNLRLDKMVQKRTIEIKGLAEELKDKNNELEKKNKKLIEYAQHDSLTGLLNHASFMKKLDETYNMAVRNNFPFCVCMIDVDFFKEYNDTYGHQTGDEILRKIAMVLSNSLRDYDIKAREEDQLMPAGDKVMNSVRNYDIAGRYGGDEFALILLFCDYNGALSVMNRVTAQVERLNITKIPDVSVTLSTGTCIVEDSGLCRNIEEIVNQADNSLYKAKKDGRDKSVIRPFKPEFPK
ncbi:MAG: diguanylate cyclase [Chitinivibrionales bacterium]